MDPPGERISGFTAREKSLCFIETENLPDRGQLDDGPPEDGVDSGVRC